MSILLKPHLTEKSFSQTADHRFVFLVDPRATKRQIKQAVEKAFKVNVVKIRTLVTQPSSRRSLTRGRIISSPKTKKAVVELRPKQTIKLFETK